MDLRRAVRNLRRGGVIVCVLYVTLLGALTSVMNNLELFDRVMSKVPVPLWKLIPMRLIFNVVRAGKLKVGDLAPDFNLPTVSKREHVRLSSFRGKTPVVLVFGSYT
jgi:hypothetical protein